MDPLSKRQVVASGSAWLAALLNVVPGLGTGYIYQRRWRAYWITSALATLWFALGILQGQDGDPTLLPDQLQRQQLIGLAGFLLLAVVTAVEAARASLRAQQEA
ncbi:hypothetical protein [Cyanobium sp. NIES-981]|uniref:hypothetical protein n=1 Tax=Cyanobium sp. NIES-981 TaxID=1851505 RepID=UPI0007DD0476|nr:hypothetical protein [Cyanobium sp. NIES-981]SBO42270.1 conserved membrane protein of unknown function [Cyanobium sp. NIES-981]